MTSLFHKPFLVLAFAAVPYVCAVPAWSQQTASEPNSDVLEEVVVTAQKRAQNAQDVGVSITALGQESLALLGVRDINELATRVPSLRAEQFSPMIVILNIRGVSQNDFSSSVQEAPIAFYNDEVYSGSLAAISGQNFDLERVEVLRGPQGTVFGRNATGGLVQVVTARPTYELEGHVQLTRGSFGQLSSEAVVSGPLSSALRGRLSLSTNRNDGYIERTAGPPNEARTNFYAGRGQLEADIPGAGTLRLKMEYLRNSNETTGPSNIASGFDADGLGYALPSNVNFWGPGGAGYPGFLGGIFGPLPTAPCPGCDITGYKSSDNHYRTDSNYAGAFGRTYRSLTVRYDQDLGFGGLTSITNYQNVKLDFSTNALSSSVSPGVVAINVLDTSQYSQELRLAGATGRHNWLVGIYGMKLDAENTNFVGTPPDTPLPSQLHIFFDARPTTRSAAAFAQDELKLTDVFTFIAGARYSTDWKKINFAHALAPPFTPEFPDLVFNPATDPRASQRFGDYSFKAGLDAKPNSDTLLYLSVSRGTKAGGFNTPTFPPYSVDTLNYGKEDLTAYEAGYKLTLADQKVNLNGAVFHYNYQNYQAFSNLTLGQVITNHPAQINGLEAEVVARPIASLRFNLFATRLFTARVDDMVLPFGRKTDRRMPQTPNWSLGGSASYDVSTGRGVFRFATNWKYDGEQYLTAFNAQIDREPGHAVGDVRVSFTTSSTSSGAWEAAAFVNNVTNNVHRMFNFDFGTSLGMSEAIFAPPRWFGGSVTYRFANH